jgi:hypothetical protein
MTDNAVEFAKQGRSLSRLFHKPKFIKRTGWGGYIVPTSRVTFNNPLITATDANSSMLVQSFKQFILSLPGGNIIQADEPSYASFFQRFIIQEASAVSFLHIFEV